MKEREWRNKFNKKMYVDSSVKKKRKLGFSTEKLEGRWVFIHPNYIVINNML